MRGANFQRHLVVGAEVDGLDVAPGPQIPEVDAVAVFVRQQILRHDSVLELRRQPPLARHHVVAWQVPPEIIVHCLGAAIEFPPSEHLERLAIHDEDAGRSIGAVLAAPAERRNVDAFRPAVNGVGPRVSGLFEDFLRLDDLVNRCLGGIRLGIDDIDAGRPHAGNDEIAAFEEGVSGERR